MAKKMNKVKDNNPLNGEIIIYENAEGQSRVSVRVEGETVWLNQAQMVDLFQSSKANVSEHIKHIFEEGELKKDSVVRKFRTTALDGKNYKIEHYNLDMIISLGYRIKSSIATKFRQWATERLNEHIRKGFTMDDERLKGAGGGNYWKELLDRIRDKILITPKPINLCATHFVTAVSQPRVPIWPKCCRLYHAFRPEESVPKNARVFWTN